MATTPVAVVCVGMAGSGKTTFMQRINSHLHSQRTPPYVINLDPAVHRVPFDCNIDIRDSINYKEVMKQYQLGPNGGILTSLNLFATKIDQILSLLEKRTAPTTPPTKPIGHILVDTPGQIEVFVWSASGSILLDSLASSFPTVIAYVIDTPRTTSTSTFMSNMLYACSILYKTKLPMILVFNKSDVRDPAFAREWMTDFEAFQDALRREEAEAASGEGGGSGYMASLLNSMSLMLEEFYRHLSVVSVSSLTGQGVDGFFDAVATKAAEFNRDYKPELERRRTERAKDKVAHREQELGRLMHDMNVSSSSGTAPSHPLTPGRGKANAQPPERKRAKKREPETISDIESSSSDNDNANADINLDDDDDDEEDAAQLVDPDSSDNDNDHGNEHGNDDDNKHEESADGLTQRYRRALANDTPGGSASGAQEDGGGRKVGDKAEMKKAARYLKAGGL